ncbi:hypothetical protein [Amycolatopsis thailandensis]|uniref:hypothetical protein n=1 Tax=Amycolatopsis thailandensis TaxID=589330 RepID=UPI001ABF31D0|nr:hypothetical protein [Amycolatopsis thailandensis]
MSSLAECGECPPPAKAEFGAVRSHIRNAEDGAFILTAVTGRGSDASLRRKGNPTVTAPNSVAENPRLDW